MLTLSEVAQWLFLKSPDEKAEVKFYKKVVVIKSRKNGVFIVRRSNINDCLLVEHNGKYRRFYLDLAGINNEVDLRPFLTR